VDEELELTGEVGAAAQLEVSFDAVLESR